MIENILAAILFSIFMIMIVGPFAIAIWAVFRK